jgi:hypothetical protein
MSDTVDMVTPSGTEVTVSEELAILLLAQGYIRKRQLVADSLPRVVKRRVRSKGS